MNKTYHVLIIGSGAYGNALKTCILTNPGNKVTILNRSDCLVYHEDITCYDFILIAVPSQSLRTIANWLYDQYMKVKSSNKKLNLISTAKGIEKQSGLLPHQIIGEIFSKEIEHKLISIGALSGPSFAKEMNLNLPTCVVLASKNKALLKHASQALHSSYFRIYDSNDILGVELGGALKNVIAMVAGAVDGLNLGNNARAAVITRGLSEMAELGVKLGANPITFMGLSGLGDLILTATGDLSRNRQFGFRLAKGENKNEILNSLGGVVEGIATTQSIYELCTKLKIKTSIFKTAFDVIYNNLPIHQALNNLLNGQQSTEFDWLGAKNEPDL